MQLKAIVYSPTVPEYVWLGPLPSGPRRTNALSRLRLPDTNPKEVAWVVATHAGKLRCARPQTPRAVERELQFHLRARNRLNLVGEYPEGKALDHMFNLLVFARPRHALRLAAAPLQQMFQHFRRVRRGATEYVSPKTVLAVVVILLSLSLEPEFQGPYRYVREHRVSILHSTP
jgi:hypothetical protein